MAFDDVTVAIICGAAALAAVTFLRVLAIHREHEIARHDLIREIRRVRVEYERKIQSGGNDDIIV